MQNQPKSFKTYSAIWNRQNNSFEQIKFIVAKSKFFGNATTNEIATNILIVEHLPDLNSQQAISEITKNLEFQEIHKIKEIAQHTEIVDFLKN